MRIKSLNLTIAVIFFFLGLGLLNLEIIQGHKLNDLSKKNCIRLIPQLGSRGRILDREGNIIAGNHLSYDVIFLPQAADQMRKSDAQKTLLSVSRILAAAPQDLSNKVKENFIAPFVPITLARDIGLREAIALEELKLNLPGILIQPRPVRDYPYAKLNSHVLGYLHEIDRWRLTKLKDYGYKTKDIVGFGGVEEKYDYYLRQEEGGLSIEVDHRGRLVRVLGFKPPRNGRDIQLTLDLKIQRIVEDALGDRRGSVVMMDPDSGAIIAMASGPNFNPATFIKKSDSSLLGIFNNPDAPLVNRAISAAYPAGSIFKLVVATAALETGKINSQTSFYCSGSINVGRQEFSCWDVHNQQGLLGAIARSCNTFFYRTGLLTGAQTIHDYALKFGFSHPTGSGLLYEASGFVPSPLWKRVVKLRNWYDGDTANFSIGQGDLLVTPLQVTRMMAVFANKGNLVTPYIVKAIHGRDIRAHQERISKVPLRASTISYIRDGLAATVQSPGGTANVLSGLAVSVAAKTGTAQVAGHHPHGWFAGFFPYREPQYVICVFLENGGSGYAATILAKQIIEAMIKEDILMSTN